MNYNLSKDFIKEVNDTLNNNLKSNTQVKVRDDTPNILVRLGIPNLPMLITQNHIKSIIYSIEEAKELGIYKKDINYHGLGKYKFIKAIIELNNPESVYKIDKENYLIITKLKDKYNKRIVIPIKVNGKGRYNDIFINENQIKSVYGRRSLLNYLKNNNFIEIYKKRRIRFQ